ncbi:MAG TPA: ribosome maturation factor RimM [Candidatus Dormibacteraeota bacterium]|nr:ribosome maturation factor RimM [Candidatus Dormibacteraeota bacterium]
MIRVGQVASPFGVDGAVKVVPLTDFADRFDRGSTLLLDGAERRVEWSRQAGGGLVVKLAGIDNRTVAELYRGRYLEVGEHAGRPAGEGRYYHHQLIGLEVVTASGDALGLLEEVLEKPANDVWVSRQGQVEHLIPATRDAVLNVDLEAKVITVANWLMNVEDAK